MVSFYGFLMALLKPPTKRKVLDPAINSNLQPKTEKDLNTNFAKEIFKMRWAFKSKV